MTDDQRRISNTKDDKKQQSGTGYYLDYGLRIRQEMEITNRLSWINDPRLDLVSSLRHISSFLNI